MNKRAGITIFRAQRNIKHIDDFIVIYAEQAGIASQMGPSINRGRKNFIVICLQPFDLSRRDAKLRGDLINRESFSLTGNSQQSAVSRRFGREITPDVRFLILDSFGHDAPLFPFLAKSL